MNCRDIMTCLSRRTPESYAMEWDNVGLLVGRRDKEVKTIMVALDATNEVVDEAIKNHVDLLVTHHPILFSAIKGVVDTDFLGSKIVSLIEHGISCYAMHTNYDICQMADLAAKYLGVEKDEPLEVTYEQDGVKMGIGSVTTLQGDMTLGECASLVKEKFALDHVLLFGCESERIKRIALSPGSGRHMIEEAKKAGVDVLITGDMGHHEGLDAMDMGISVIEAGHYGLEKIFIKDVADFLKNQFRECQVIAIENNGPYTVY